jgi:asparagine synthetase B (glutamine-hydrolysing)
MCGISGIFSRSLDEKSREKAVQNIDKSQQLRGPDDLKLQYPSRSGFRERVISRVTIGPEHGRKT